MLLLEESWSELFLLCSIQVKGKDPKNLKVHQIWIHSRYLSFNLSSFFYFQWCLPLPSPSLFSPVELPDLPPSLQVQANMIPPLHWSINIHVENNQTSFNISLTRITFSKDLTSKAHIWFPDGTGRFGVGIAKVFHHPCSDQSFPWLMWSYRSIYTLIIRLCAISLGRTELTGMNNKTT